MFDLRLLISDAKKTIIEDLRSDPYLKHILLLSFILNFFWIWWRIPNFVIPDEYSRLIDPMKAAGRFFSNPSFESLKEGVTDGGAFGATFYLYALTLVPVFIIVLLFGNLGDFVTLGNIESRWDLWHEAPSWFWSLSIITARIVNVFFGVGCVYLVYRIGTEMKDRTTGRFASLLLSLTLGLIASAHEVNEDTVTVLLLLVVFYLSYQYIETGDETRFLTGCALGGLTIAFKLTGGVTVILLGTAFFIRAYESGDGWSGIIRPKLLGLGALIGVISIYVGMPTVLFSGPQALIERLAIQLFGKTSTSILVSPPAGFWFLKGFLNGMGLPLFVASVLGICGTILKIWDEKLERRIEILALVGLLVYIVAYSRWSYIRTHHLLPTFPLLIILLSPFVAKWFNSNRRVKKVTVLILLILTSAYAVGGETKFVTEPRDDASKWIKNEIPKNTTMVVYEDSVADIGIVHGRPVKHYSFNEKNSTTVLNESEYTQWMTSTIDRQPEYIQLTDAEIDYIDPLSTKNKNFPKRAEYLKKLVNEELGYEIVKEFGTKTTGDSYLNRLITAGIVPQIEKGGKYIVILKNSDSNHNKKKKKENSR